MKKGFLGHILSSGDGQRNRFDWLQGARYEPVLLGLKPAHIWDASIVDGSLSHDGTTPTMKSYC